MGVQDTPGSFLRFLRKQLFCGACSVSALSLSHLTSSWQPYFDMQVKPNSVRSRRFLSCEQHCRIITFLHPAIILYKWSIKGKTILIGFITTKTQARDAIHLQQLQLCYLKILTSFYLNLNKGIMNPLQNLLELVVLFHLATDSGK